MIVFQYFLDAQDAVPAASVKMHASGHFLLKRGVFLCEHTVCPAEMQLRILIKFFYGFPVEGPEIIESVVDIENGGFDFCFEMHGILSVLKKDRIRLCRIRSLYFRSLYAVKNAQSRRSFSLRAASISLSDMTFFSGIRTVPFASTPSKFFTKVLAQKTTS